MKMSERKGSLSLSLVVAASAIAAALLSGGLMSPERAIAAPSGDKIYSMNCSGCHMNGGNSLSPSKPVKGSKKLATKEDFKAYLSKANGTMPPFPKVAGNDEALAALYNYCKTLK